MNRNLFDRLKTELESIYDNMLKRIKIDKDNSDYWEGKADAYRNVIDAIDSLQQEQPEELHFTPLNRLIQKIPSEKWSNSTNNYAKKLRDCLIKEGYLKDAQVLQDYISYMNGNNVPMATMDEQEQPEVDLEKEKKKWYDKGYKDATDKWLPLISS